MRKKENKIRDEEIIKEYENGLTMSEIGYNYNISRQRVSFIINNRKINIELKENKNKITITINKDGSINEGYIPIKMYCNKTGISQVNLANKIKNGLEIDIIKIYDEIFIKYEKNLNIDGYLEVCEYANKLDINPVTIQNNIDKGIISNYKFINGKYYIKDNTKEMIEKRKVIYEYDFE